MGNEVFVEGAMQKQQPCQRPIAVLACGQVRIMVFACGNEDSVSFERLNKFFCTLRLSSSEFRD